jgi:type IV pilus assembly protein PilM
MVAALREAREGRKFRGKSAVLCLGPQQLFVQNVRVVRPVSGSLDVAVRQEVESRLPFPLNEAELRYLEAADVRQGDAVRREVIAMACHKPQLDRVLQIVEDAGLRPVGVEVEATALLRCYRSQYRRDEDHEQRTLYVHMGSASTAVLITQGSDILLFKYLDIGGRQLDAAIARHLKMDPADAWSLRRNAGDRRADQQDPDIVRSISEATRPVIDRLVNELAMCTRYHSVTFRGQPLKRMVIAGGEATPALVDKLAVHLDIKSELGDPFRAIEATALQGRRSQWDVALGLAMKPLA